MKSSFLSLSLLLFVAPLLVFAAINEEGVIREDDPDEETTIEPYDDTNERRLDHHYYYDNHYYAHKNRPKPDIEYWALNRGSFSTLTVLASGVGLIPGILGQPGDYTFFAPSNMAFRELFRTYPGLRRYLLSPAGAGALTQVLSYHVLLSSVFSQDIPPEGISGTDMQGDQIQVFKDCRVGDYYKECSVYILDGTDEIAFVTHVDNEANNGVVHAIDKVLIPGSLVNAVEAFRRN